MLSWDDDVLAVPIANVHTGFQRRMLQIVGGKLAGDEYLVPARKHGVLNAYVATLCERGMHDRRVKGRLRIARGAQDIAACLLSDCEAAVRPAFAPPRAVI